jgi:hypothetical protein
MPAVPPIFDGEKEAKLIASWRVPTRPWSLRLLEDKVVELKYCRARQRLNDRSLFKKTLSNLIMSRSSIV